MSLIDEAREVKDWINSDDPCDTGDLEPGLVLQMCNYILTKSKKSEKAARVWQITDEREKAIRDLSGISRDIGCDKCHPFIQKYYGHSIQVLRAMLEEVGQ